MIDILVFLGRFLLYMLWNTWARLQVFARILANSAWYLGEACWQLFRPIFSFTNVWTLWAVPIWQRVWKDYGRPALVYLLNLLRLSQAVLLEASRPTMLGARSMTIFGQLALARLALALVNGLSYIRGVLPSARIPFVTVAGKVDTELHRAAVALVSPFATLKRKGNVIIAWLNHLFEETGLLARGVFLQTALHSLASLVHLVANVGQPNDPAPAIVQLRQRYPKRPIGALVEEWRTGAILQRPAVGAGVELFKALVL